MADRFRRKTEPRHIRLYHSITGSEAWLHLSGNAMKVLIALARYDDGSRNGELLFSERQGVIDTGLSRNTVRRALAELIEKGFIALTKPGAFNRNNLLAATYRLTWLPWPGGRPAAPTRDFEKWRAGNSQAQNFVRSGAEIEPPWENSSESGTKSEPPNRQDSRFSIDCSVSKIEPQVLYHGVGSNGSTSSPEISITITPLNGAKSRRADCAGVDLDELRDWTKAAIASLPYGGQRVLAQSASIPEPVLSKFKSGKGLKDDYRMPLQAACARVLPHSRFREAAA